jgi:hypothetical protein
MRLYHRSSNVTMPDIESVIKTQPRKHQHQRQHTQLEINHRITCIIYISRNEAFRNFLLSALPNTNLVKVRNNSSRLDSLCDLYLTGSRPLK